MYNEDSAIILAKRLKVFVVESNGIEGITAEEGNPLFDDHLCVAQMVVACSERGKLIGPLEIHAVLCAHYPTKYK